MFASDEEIEQKYRDKASAYAAGIIYGGTMGAVASLITGLLVLAILL